MADSGGGGGQDPPAPDGNQIDDGAPRSVIPNLQNAIADPTQWHLWLHAHHKEITEWAKREASTIAACSGSPVESVRVWARAIRLARRSVPQSQVAAESAFMDELICRTTTEFFRETYYDIREVRKTIDSLLYDVDRVIEELTTAYLTDSERQSLQDALPRQRQTASENVHAYVRRYTRYCKQAFADTNLSEKEMIVGCFIEGLRDDRIKARLYDLGIRHDLPKVQDAAVVEESKARFRRRMAEKAKAVSQTADVSSVNTQPKREQKQSDSAESQIKELKNRLAQLEGANKNKQQKSKTSSSDTPKTKDMSKVKCWKCKKMGHFKNACPESNPADQGN